MENDTLPWFYRISILVSWCLALIVLATMPAPAKADIYMYRDADGILHFTNTPNSSKYRVFLKTRKSGDPPTASAFDPFIEEASLQHGVDFQLIKAVIRAESGFNHRAVSRKGARGLMQIMPQNFGTLQLRNPFDPRENIMAGTQYLRLMLDRFEGKIGLSLAAYNCGPTLVERYQCVPPIDETLDYVEKVLRYYRQYQASR